MRRASAISACAVALLAISAGAHAQVVSVLGIEAQEVPEQLARELTDALRQRAATVRTFTPAPTKDLTEIKLVFGCVDEAPACMAHAGKTLGADKVLFGSIRKTSAGFKVMLRWLDVP